MKKLKIGVLGAGEISDIHLEIFGRNPNVSVIAIADIDIKLAKEKALRYNIKRISNDCNDIIKSKDIDVIDILLSHFLHADIAIESLRNNKIVICEKPLAVSISGANRVIREVKKTGIKLYLKHYFRYLQAHKRIKELINKGEIGRPYLANCLYTTNSIKNMNDENTWKGNIIEAGGGVLLDAGIHMIDYLQYLFGDPVSVFANCKKNFTQLKTKSEDLAILNADLPNNITANIICTCSDTSFGFRWEKHFFGSKGSLHLIDYGKNRNELILIKNKEIQWKETENNWWYNANKKALNDIIGRIIKKQDPPISLNTAFIGLKTILSAYISSKDGVKKTIKL